MEGADLIHHGEVEGVELPDLQLELLVPHGVVGVALHRRLERLLPALARDGSSGGWCCWFRL